MGDICKYKQLFWTQVAKSWSSFSQILHLCPVLEQKSHSLSHLLQQKLTKESLLAKYYQIYGRYLQLQTTFLDSSQLILSTNLLWGQMDSPLLWCLHCNSSSPKRHIEPELKKKIKKSKSNYFEIKCTAIVIIFTCR